MLALAQRRRLYGPLTHRPHAAPLIRAQNRGCHTEIIRSSVCSLWTRGEGSRQWGQGTGRRAWGGKGGIARGQLGDSGSEKGRERGQCGRAMWNRVSCNSEVGWREGSGTRRCLVSPPGGTAGRRAPCWWGTVGRARVKPGGRRKQDKEISRVKDNSLEHTLEPRKKRSDSVWPVILILTHISLM